MVLHSEFATVEVDLDGAGNGPRLRIRNPRSGTCICLDPLELETLTRLSHRDFAVLVDPSFAGLGGEEGDPA